MPDLTPLMTNKNYLVSKTNTHQVQLHSEKRSPRQLHGFHVLMLAILFIVLTNSAQAQESIVINPTFISVAEGVATTTVNAVHQDQHGLLWLATAHGLQRYDGYTFQIYRNDLKNPQSLAHNTCWSVTSDSEGNIWVTTDFGISRFNRNSETFKNYLLFDSSGESPNRCFEVFEDSQKRLWTCTTSKEIMLYNAEKDQWESTSMTDSGKPLKGPGQVLQIVEDNTGGLWTGIARVGLFHAKPGSTAFELVNDKLDIEIDLSMSEHSISALYVDSRNKLWFTTRNGVFNCDPKTGKCTTLALYNYLILDVWNNWNAIAEDAQGDIWISNNFRGLLLFKNGQNTPTRVDLSGNPYIENQPSNVSTTTFSIDRTGIFWFGTRGNGVMKYDPASKPFTLLTATPNTSNSLQGNDISALAESNKNKDRIFIGQRGTGLSVYNQETREFINPSIPIKKETSANSVRSILELHNGNLLVGTWGDGMIEMDQNFNEIGRYEYLPSTTSIQSDQIRVLKQGNDGTVWVGTNSGLSKWNPTTKQIINIDAVANRRYPYDIIQTVEALQRSPASINIFEVGDYANLTKEFDVKSTTTYLVAMMGEGRDEDLFDYGFITNLSGDTIWNGFMGEKAYHAGGAIKNRLRYDVIRLETGSYKLHYVSDDSHSIVAFNEAVPDNPELWGISIVPNSDADLIKMLESFHSETNSNRSLRNPNIMDIEVSDSAIWVATDGGLNKLDAETGQNTVFRSDALVENTLVSNLINCLEFDAQGMLWIGTENGLDRFDPVTNAFTHYTIADGLPVNIISSIVIGDEGELWISTLAGLSRMVLNEKLGKATFINYHVEDGLGAEDFVPLVGLRATDGTYYFGNTRGLVTFRAIEGSSSAPDIVVSKMMIANRPYSETFTDTTNTHALESVTELTLAYDQNDINIEFTALHYANPTKNQYAHKLEGFDEDWIYDNRNFASYTNLEPGEYEFKMRASNSYGVWNEEGKSIKITILPPWWQTWWAYAVYIFLFALIIFGIDRIMRRRIALREERKNKDRELLQAKEIEKAYHSLEQAHMELKGAQKQLIQQEKLASLGQLTAGIAHEIKNPLNFVNNFSELSIELVDELKETLEDRELGEKRQEVDGQMADIKANLQKIVQHGTRADGIVKSMLQHSRGGSGKMEPNDLNALLREVVNLAFHGMRASKAPINVKLDFDLDENMGEVQIIGEDFSRVVLNLANNAFDAMREKIKSDADYKPGLTVRSRRNTDSIEISVADNGPGIPKAISDKIFQPFFTTKKGTDGTGLGLSLSYDIIKAHGGDVKVISSEGGGSEFLIQIPVLKSN